MTAEFDNAIITAQTEYDKMESAYAQSKIDLAVLQREYDAYKQANPPAATFDVLMDVNFEKYPAGPFTRQMALETFGKGTTWTGGSDAYWRDHNVTIKTVDGKGVLSVFIPKNTMGTAAAPAFSSPLIREVDDLTFSMDYRVTGGFLPDIGGKLPGFGSTNDPTMSPPTGGAEPTNGNSCRHMWHTVSNKPPGILSTYIYHPNTTTSQWGEDLYLDKAARIDVWENITTRAKNNTPGKNDGFLQSRMSAQNWYINRSDYLWRPVATPAWRFNRLVFSVFRGGNTQDWASDQDATIQFKRFLITTPKV